MQEITVSNLRIDLIKKNIKNMHLSVHPPNGRVRIAVPRNTNEEQVRMYIISKLDWIRKQQKKLASQNRISARDYVSGESHYFLGERYLLNVIYTTGKQMVEIANKTQMDLFVRKESSVEQRERVMNEWYRKELKIMIPDYISKWESKMNVEVLDWRIKRMKTKWGSCNTEQKRIWLNLELAKKAPHCLEYVIVHEMTHLLERKHNNQFKAYMDQFIPNWRAIRNELNHTLFESNEKY